jgi:hypothetical protein
VAYRIYFRNQQGFIIGRDDYIAEDDEHAMVVARTLQNACSDLCTGIEVWSGIRRVDAAPIKATNGWSTDEIAARTQSTVLTTEVAPRDSRWVIADSARRLEETRRLLGASRGRSP